jgi:hypothetical protein
VEDDPAVDIRSSGRIAIHASTNLEGGPLAGNISAAVYALAGDDDPDMVMNAITAHAGQDFAVNAINNSTQFPTVSGENLGVAPGLAGVSYGHGPQLLLFREDEAPSGPPTVWSEAGAIRFDAAGDLWLCITTGDPGTWTRLLREDTAAGRTVPITPFRALDSRAAGGRPSGSPAVPGQTQGPLHGGQAVTLDLAGAATIPATAAGVVGNLTVLTPSYNGYLRAAPSGTTVLPSAINFTKGATIANAFTSALGPNGLTITGSGGSSNTYQLVVDITAYIT